MTFVDSPLPHATLWQPVSKSNAKAVELSRPVLWFREANADSHILKYKLSSRFKVDGRDYWIYEHVGAQHKLLVRFANTTLVLVVQTQIGNCLGVGGIEKIILVDLEGNVAYTEDVVPNKFYRVCDVAERCKSYLMANNTITEACSVKLLQPGIDEPLNGRVTLNDTRKRSMTISDDESPVKQKRTESPCNGGSAP